MPKIEKPLDSLSEYLPEGCLESVVGYIQEFKIHLTITRHRQTVLGDFRHSVLEKQHKISVNGTLNRYEFLITFLHELAHLITFESFGHRVEPHGKEWKENYRFLLLKYVAMNVFPEDIKAAISRTIDNPAATANGEEALILALRNYNVKADNRFISISILPEGAVFLTEKGKKFQKVGKRRTRFECIEINTGRRFSFSSLSMVFPLNQPTV